MTVATVVLDLCSYWHAGTGRGAGPELDAVCFRSAAGLPMLPGRTLRGLLRDALTRAAAVGALTDMQWTAGDPVEWCFGTGLDAGSGDDRVARQEEARFRTVPGHLHISSALLGRTEAESAQWEQWAADGYGARIEHLFRPFASTKVAADGMGEDKTLRAVELAVPMRLRATIDGPDAPGWLSLLQTAAPLLRSLGSHRNRGLGRVTVTIENGATR